MKKSRVCRDCHRAATVEVTEDESLQALWELVLPGGQWDDRDHFFREMGRSIDTFTIEHVYYIILYYIILYYTILY